MPIKSTQSRGKFVDQEKQDQREAWLKLVVKIIRWSDEPSKGSSNATEVKITQTDWKNYTEGMVKTNITYSKQRVLSKLESTKELIQKHGGFQDD